MKKTILTAVVVQLVAVAAFAQSPVKPGGDANPSGISTPMPSTSSTPRADVKAEAKAANKAGALKGGDANPAGMTMPNSPSDSTTTRADVKADTKAAASRGELQTNDATLPGDKKPTKKPMRKHKMKPQKPTDEMGSADTPAK